MKKILDRELGREDIEEKGKMCATNIEKLKSNNNCQTPCMY